MGVIRAFIKRVMKSLSKEPCGGGEVPGDKEWDRVEKRMKLMALKKRLKKQLPKEAKRRRRAAEKHAPVYDDVFFEGVRQLDGMATGEILTREQMAAQMKAFKHDSDCGHVAVVPNGFIDADNTMRITNCTRVTFPFTANKGDWILITEDGVILMRTDENGHHDVEPV